MDFDREKNLSMELDDNEQIVVEERSKPRWQFMVESPILEQPANYKIKVKYGGYFKLIKSSSRRKYCFPKQKTICVDMNSSTLNDLMEEVRKLFPLESSKQIIALCFEDKHASEQTFVPLDSDDKLLALISMYEEKKEVTIYVTDEQSTVPYSSDINMQCTEMNIYREGCTENSRLSLDEEDSDYCVSEESYHSHYSSGGEDEILMYEEETCAYDKDGMDLKVSSTFRNAVAFKRALNHYSLTKEFEYVTEKSDPTRFTARCADPNCKWRIHASLLQDDVTFEVKIMKEVHTCTKSNKSGNKSATQGWIADMVIDKLRSEGDVSVKVLKKWLNEKYNVEIPYSRVFRGKEQALNELYGKWEDSFLKMDDFKEELLRRNPGSVVDIHLEKKNNKYHFQRFFISFGACSRGFLQGCRPYIALDACHLKGKFKGVLAAATAVDGNNWMFPVAYGVLESENASSWIWFLEALQLAIGTPEGLVISSDMQKGLGLAVAQVYPCVEHRECAKHLYNNFKRHFGGVFFKASLWEAAKTYSPNRFNEIMNELRDVRPEAVDYLENEHGKIWSRSKFGVTAKCDYLTSNIAETFNSWIDEARYRPVLELLDIIREKIMEIFHRRRIISRKWKGVLVPSADKYIKAISKGLGGYVVRRSTDTRAEIRNNGSCWEVMLDQKTCTCRAWQVKGLPCVHAAVFIGFIRDPNWANYVDSYFSIEMFKFAYAEEIAPMPGKDQWISVKKDYKISPPLLKRPPGRPRKNRIKSSDEPKKRLHKCRRCKMLGHHQKTCKNPVPPENNMETTFGTSVASGSSQASNNKRGPRKGTKGSRNKKPCPIIQTDGS